MGEKVAKKEGRGTLGNGISVKKEPDGAVVIRLEPNFEGRASTKKWITHSYTGDCGPGWLNINFGR